MYLYVYENIEIILINQQWVPLLPHLLKYLHYTLFIYRL